MHFRYVQPIKYVLGIIIIFFIVLIQISLFNRLVGLKYINLILCVLTLLIVVNYKFTLAVAFGLGFFSDLLLPTPFPVLTIGFLIIISLDYYLHQRIFINRYLASIVLLLSINILIYNFYLWLTIRLLYILKIYPLAIDLNLIFLKNIFGQIVFSAIFIVLIYFIFRQPIQKLHDKNIPFYSSIRTPI